MSQRGPVGRPRLYADNAEKCREYRQRKKREARRRKKSDLYGTPKEIFTPLHAVFHFTLDVCADARNAKCPRYFTAEDDGLRQVWTGVCWCNPPYSRPAPWVQKAYESAGSGVIVVCLLSSSTETDWWHSYVLRAAVISFVPRRIKFDGGRYHARFANTVVLFRPGPFAHDGAMPRIVPWERLREGGIDD